jgi:glycogen debranching enzyme
MIAPDGTMDGGLLEYGGQWVRDSSNTALGALHAGHFEAARNVLQHMLSKMISRDGVTMIAESFETPDREQFDQGGELLHLLRCYRDWTGDDSLIRQHRDLLIKVVERPLQPQFRDDTGMVHNRREFWERAFDDAYELAYQTYVILALREAAELAPSLGADDRAARWRAEADRIQQAMLSHPDRALVRDGRLIKRRNVTGAVADDTGGFPGFAPDGSADCSGDRSRPQRTRPPHAR